MAKRRANREGTIYKRTDGRWVASVTLPGGRRKSYYGKTREDVSQKLIKGLKAAQDGLPVSSEQPATDRMEGSTDDARRGAAIGRRANPGEHLLSGAAAEGKQQDSLRIDPVG